MQGLYSEAGECAGILIDPVWSELESQLEVGRDNVKNQKTWVSNLALLPISCVALGKSFPQGLGFHLLKMEVIAAICLQGCGEAPPAHTGSSAHAPTTPPPPPALCVLIVH